PAPSPTRRSSDLDGTVARGDDAEAGIAVAERDDIEIAGHILAQGLADLAAEDRVEMVIVAEKERQADETVFRAPVGQRAEIGPDEVDRAELHGLGALAQAGNLAGREDLDGDLAIGLLRHDFGEAVRSHVDEVIRRQ